MIVVWQGSYWFVEGSNGERWLACQILKMNTICCVDMEMGCLYALGESRRRVERWCWTRRKVSRWRHSSYSVNIWATPWSRSTIWIWERLQARSLSQASEAHNAMQLGCVFPLNYFLATSMTNWCPQKSGLLFYASNVAICEDTGLWKFPNVSLSLI